MSALRATRFSVASVLLSSLALACSVAASDDANGRVADVTLVGTSVTSALYATGDLGFTTIPKDGANAAVLADDLRVEVHVTSPPGVTVDVASTACTQPDQKSIAVGVIIDDSGSMTESDPKRARKDATVGFLNALAPDDRVLLTDYGNTEDDLRDLLCSAAPATPGKTQSCSPPAAAFSNDRAALIAAADQIDDGGGTPLFEGCLEMVPLVDSIKDQRRGMLLLSDGEPNSTDKRDACHAAAKTAQIPVFTVGLGPAAEGDPSVDPDAVKVLRELASDTGGSYASANDPKQLQQLFTNISTALTGGSCLTATHIHDPQSLIQPGVTVSGDVTIGSNGAKATFDFVAPSR